MMAIPSNPFPFRSAVPVGFILISPFPFTIQPVQLYLTFIVKNPLNTTTVV